jgi:serine/threonine protein kinase
LYFSRSFYDYASRGRDFIVLYITADCDNLWPAMDAERWEKVAQLYDSVCELTPAERSAFLAQACEGDEELRREVESLLQENVSQPGVLERVAVPAWLNRPPVDMARSLAGSQVPKMKGRRLSGYTLIREIGHGGMGRVYLAERSDGAFRKQVAIKLVLPSPDTADIVARFQQERAILASLDHPNIARLLDGGVTEEGWPYFVMEFVDGQPIDLWCDERKLSVSERIKLFRSVVAAVRYAHQRLVVHKDLKPENIFVTNDGTVKLLDFGIAKVLSNKGSGEPPETLTLGRIMTPEYASPEQVSGEPITTLSDVYSLGVILYELLTGHRPYRLLSAAMHEMARVIAEEEPTRPSDVVATTESALVSGREAITPDAVSAVREGDPLRLKKRLTGDLDSILLMALRKEPERRYSSVESFADDLQRHLEHRPVTAREASPWDRAKRFCRRNPGGVAAGVLVLLSLFAGAGTLIWQARRSLQTAPSDSASVFLAPVWAYFAAIAAVALGAAIYFLRPSRRELVAAAIGGVVFGGAAAGKWWLEHELGWWHSRFPLFARSAYGVKPVELACVRRLRNALHIAVLRDRAPLWTHAPSYCTAGVWLVSGVTGAGVPLSFPARFDLPAWIDPDPRRRCDVDRWRSHGTCCHAPRRRGKRDEAEPLVIFG